MSKGDWRRPRDDKFCSEEQFEQNYERTFGKPTTTKEEKKREGNS